MALNDEDQEEGSLVERKHRRALDRLLALSDGVFAIAITLLVLELTTPELIGAASEGNVGHLLDVSLSRMLSYAIGFAVIALYWVGHRRVFLLVERTDSLLTFLNMALLMCIAFMPFPTALLQEPRSGPVLFYAGTQTLTGTINLAMWLHATTDHRLISRSVNRRLLLHHTLRVVVTPAVFLLSMAIAPFRPQLAEFFWGSIIVFLLLLDVVFPRESEQDRRGRGRRR